MKDRLIHFRIKSGNLDIFNQMKNCTDVRNVERFFHIQF